MRPDARLLPGARRPVPGCLRRRRLVSLAVLVVPADDVPSVPPGVDKAVDVPLFLALTLSAGGRACGGCPSRCCRPATPR